MSVGHFLSVGIPACLTDVFRAVCDRQECLSSFFRIVCCGIVHIDHCGGSVALLPPRGCVFVVSRFTSTGSALSELPDVAMRGIIPNGMMFAKWVRVR